VTDDIWNRGHSIYARTKTRLPALTTEIIERPRLRDALENARDSAVVLIQAPGGYGKTTVLQQWGTHLAARGAAVAWFTADVTDREPEAFLTYLTRALDEAGVVVNEEVRSLRTRAVMYSWRMFATALANNFVAAPRPCYLVIDDVQNLRGSAALECLQHLMDAAPPELRFVLATREELGIPLGRLRATGQCVELPVEQLKFDSAEISSYLARRGHAALTPQQIVTVEARTEGWIAGLKLLSMALEWKRQEEITAPVVTGEQREIADFFAEDVLARQPAELQEFLLRTCVLDRLSPMLCDSLPGVRDSRELLDRCHAGGLFVVALDGTRTWYRYHQLFADFLRRKLKDRDRGLADELCVAASRWFEATASYSEAFDYALRGNDSIRAAEILDAQCEAMWTQGRQETIQAFAARLPPHVQALYPRIMLALAWRLTAQWRADEARQLVAVSRARLAEIERSGADSALTRSLRLQLLHRESRLACYHYQPEAAERLCRQALADGDEPASPYLTASVFLTLQYALREQFDLEPVPRYIENAQLLMERTGFSHGLVFHAAECGPSYLLLGRTADAIALLTRGLGIATELAGAGSALAAIVAPHLAYAFYECDRIEEATLLMGAYGDRPPVGLADQLVSLYLTRSRLARGTGDYAQALELLDAAFDFADKHGLNRLRAEATAERVRVLLRMAQLDRARQAARQTNLTVSLEQPGSRRRQTTLDSRVAQAWCRLAAVTGQLSEAVTLARRWRGHAAAADAAHAAAEWGVLLAELLLLAGDRNAAQRALVSALEKAAPGSFVRMFVDAGEPIAGLIEHLANQESLALRWPPDFLHRVAVACGCAPRAAMPAPSPAAGSAPVSGRLHGRELEILRLAGTGLLNKQISEQLGLTEGTVKWYLQQVYDKLGVRDRNRAAAMARQLGLIS
jgi:LuxR family maltose regulon positive regulatory protein